MDAHQFVRLNLIGNVSELDPQVVSQFVEIHFKYLESKLVTMETLFQTMDVPQHAKLNSVSSVLECNQFVLQYVETHFKPCLNSVTMETKKIETDVQVHALSKLDFTVLHQNFLQLV